GCGELIAEIALHVLERERDAVGALCFTHAIDAGRGAGFTKSCFDPARGVIACILRRLYDLVDNYTRDAIREECERLAEIGSHEKCDDMGVKRPRGGDRVGKHRSIALSAGYGSKDLGDTHGVLAVSILSHYRMIGRARQIRAPSTDDQKQDG